MHFVCCSTCEKARVIHARRRTLSRNSLRAPKTSPAALHTFAAWPSSAAPPVLPWNTLVRQQPRYWAVGLPLMGREGGGEGRHMWGQEAAARQAR